MIHRSWINLITHTQQAIVREERLSTAFFLSSFSERPRYINLFRTFWKERKTFFFFEQKDKTNCRRVSLTMTNPAASKKLIEILFFFFCCCVRVSNHGSVGGNHKSTWRDSSFSMAIITQRLWYYSSSHIKHIKSKSQSPI